jgi:hypothetical protein
MVMENIIISSKSMLVNKKNNAPEKFRGISHYLPATTLPSLSTSWRWYYVLLPQLGMMYS